MWVGGWVGGWVCLTCVYEIDGKMDGQRVADKFSQLPSLSASVSLSPSLSASVCLSVGLLACLCQSRLISVSASQYVSDCFVSLHLSVGQSACPSVHLCPFLPPSLPLSTHASTQRHTFHSPSLSPALHSLSPAHHAGKQTPAPSIVLNFAPVLHSLSLTHSLTLALSHRRRHLFKLRAIAPCALLHGALDELLVVHGRRG